MGRAILALPPHRVLRLRLAFNGFTLLAETSGPFWNALTERYRLERELGRGGMATVYLAHDLRHDRPVALKILKPELALTLGPERFLREIRLAARLQHPHILTVHDSGEAAGRLWYTMPYVEGETLRQRLMRERELPVEDALQITRNVASALAYAHDRGIIHRDIKPENILLEAGEAVVADFGIAKALSASGGEQRLTETGLTLGTPAYMSPEQATGEQVDGRSDIYALGCVLYEMLAGEPPHTGPTAQAIIARRLSEPPPRLRTIRDVSPSLEQAIYRALSRNPADRFSTARDFARAISETGASVPEMTVAAPAGRVLQRKQWTALAGALLLAFALGLGWLAWHRQATTGPPPSATRVAILPFAVRGSGSLSYLAEGMVDLLSRELDGAGDLRTIDPGTVITATARNSNGLLDVERGRSIARRVGAGLYVLGSVLAVGPRVRIQATLYDQGEVRAAAPTQVSVEGDSAQLFELVDRLSGQLLVKRGRGPVSRLAETAAITTRSLVALKAYLDGERRLRAASLQPARLDSAITMYQQAVTEDSSFALAHYRMAVAAGWANRPGMSTAAARRALTSSDRLAQRDRRLLKAYVDFRRGAADSAERHYRAILQDYPDDLEALFQLGDVLYNYNPLRGRPRGEAREPFAQVLALDPGFL